MIQSDVTSVWLWWFILFVFGIGFLPLSMTIFSRFFDKGYIFSKLLGVAIASYVVYLLGISHLVPFGQISSFVVVFVLIGACYYFIPKKWRLRYLFRANWKIFLAEEILFVCALFFWAYVHSFAPDIHGLEKYMDFGFINSILRSTYFPPKDMWFTPYPINYYYYGHYITAFLTKLSGIPSFITFNLMMSTIFTFCLTQTFALGTTLYVYLRKGQRIRIVKVFMAGILTAAIATFAGNLHILYGFFGTYDPEKPVPFWQLPFKPWTFPNAYWYPNATRFIYHTIHEFPIYSWTVADLHGHVLDIPFVLFVVAVLLSMFLSVDPEEDEGLTDEVKKQTLWQKIEKTYPLLVRIETYFDVHVGYIILLGFLISIMYMTNAWDGAIYLLLSALLFFAIGWQKHQEENASYKHSEPTVTVIATAKDSKKAKHANETKWIRPFLEKITVSVVAVGIFFVLFSFPYNANFKPFVSGIGVLCAPKFLTDKGKIGPFLFEVDHCQHSYWWELLTLYGFFYFFAISFLVFLIRAKKVFRSDLFVLLLILLSTLLIAIPEFIYVKDIYPAHYRANTMFKLVFQAFILLSISSGYIIVRLLAPAEKGSGFLRKVVFPYFLFFPVTLVLGTLVFTYPYLAVNSYYGNFRNYQGLDGITYLKKQYPDDYNAIAWLNANVKGQPVILEAQGDSYTDYARVSANTGLPTVLGWTVHEWLWRGTYSVPAPRITEVQTMYETKDLTVLKPLLQKYAVKYVFVGTMESQKYPNLDEQKFALIGKIVFQSGNTKIYEITTP